MFAISAPAYLLRIAADLRELDQRGRARFGRIRNRTRKPNRNVPGAFGGGPRFSREPRVSRVDGALA
jgi:hypothetical protein